MGHIQNIVEDDATGQCFHGRQFAKEFEDDGITGRDAVFCLANNPLDPRIARLVKGRPPAWFTQSLRLFSQIATFRQDFRQK